jgi:transcriptional regulator with XRE-family HTH domain
MPHKRLHPLRHERRSAALSQADVTALLGGRWKQRIAWYEGGGLPSLEAALALEAILGKPVSELLAETYGAVAADVRRRARTLLEDTKRRTTPRHLRRERSLIRIASS